MLRRLAAIALGTTLVLLVLIQFVPYRVTHPPVTQGPQWDRAVTEQLARRACFDCHSNETKVPWYGAVAPVAWILRDHVDEGRAALNLSELDRPLGEEADEAGEVVREGDMPPRYYLALHPEARLTDAERRALAAGLEATLGLEGQELHAEDRTSGD